MKRVKKSVLSLVLAIVMLLSLNSTTFAMKQYTAQAVDFTIVKDSMERGVNYPIVVINDKTYLCLTDICKIFKTSWEWDANSRTIYLESRKNVVYDTDAPYAPDVVNVIGIAPDKVEFIDGKKATYYFDTSFDYKLMNKYSQFLSNNGFALLSNKDNTLLFVDRADNAIMINAQTIDQVEYPLFIVVYLGKVSS